MVFFLTISQKFRTIFFRILYSKTCLLEFFANLFSVILEFFDYLFGNFSCNVLEFGNNFWPWVLTFIVICCFMFLYANENSVNCLIMLILPGFSKPFVCHWFLTQILLISPISYVTIRTSNCYLAWVRSYISVWFWKASRVVRNIFLFARSILMNSLILNIVIASNLSH